MATNNQNGDAAAGTPSQIPDGDSPSGVPQSVSGADGSTFETTPAPTMTGGNVALLNDPVDVIIDKLLRYVIV